MFFRKIGCLVGLENWVKQKLISAMTALQSQKGFSVSILLLNEFQAHRQRERERERERARRESTVAAQLSFG